MNNLVIAIMIFIILTLVHPLADFTSAHRKWKGEYWLTLNPFHALWDISPFRVHAKYVTVLTNGDITVNRSFWWWLGIDQLAHVLLNLLLAVLIFVFPILVIVPIIWILIAPFYLIYLNILSWRKKND